MPKYTFKGDTAKALVDTTPPHECLNPGDVFEVAETLDGAEFESAKAAKAAPEAPKEVSN